MFYQPSNNELREVSRAHSREEVIVIDMEQNNIMARLMKYEKEAIILTNEEVDF